MDARDMADFETGSFDAVIDKGMTDSVMYNDKFSLMMAKVRGTSFLIPTPSEDQVRTS